MSTERIYVDARIIALQQEEGGGGIPDGDKGGTASAVQLEFMRLYLETDY